MTVMHLRTAFALRTWRSARSTVMIASVALVPAIAHAQSSALRETLKPAAIDASPRPVCSAAKPAAAPTDEQRRRARDLAQRGQQAAILGDNPLAVRELRDASVLDPTDPDLAYQLARAYETAKDAANAAKEYCRFLVLSPTAPEAGEVVEKVRILMPPKLDSSLAMFQSGIAAYQRGQMAAADTAFTKAIVSDSTWADAYYNRAQVRLARDDRERARADLVRYLQLKPGADDRAKVGAQISAVGHPPLSSSRALALGVIPGGGQFYTHRPIRGVLTIAGVAAAVGFALVEKRSTITVEKIGTDPWGQNPYPYPAKLVKTERPYLIPGAVAAGGIVALSAWNAAMYARSSSDGARVAVSFVPGANVVVARLTLFTR